MGPLRLRGGGLGGAVIRGDPLDAGAVDVVLGRQALRRRKAGGGSGTIAGGGGVSTLASGGPNSGDAPTPTSPGIRPLNGLELGMGGV